jgi:hypothetical protein
LVPWSKFTTLGSRRIRHETQATKAPGLNDIHSAPDRLPHSGNDGMAAVMRVAGLLAWGAGWALGQTYTIQTIAGVHYPNGIPATAASIAPARAAVDSDGNVFIADSFRN